MKKDSDIIDIETGSGKIAKDEAEHIVTTIDCVMARTNTLKVLIQDHDGDTSFFDDVAEDIYNNVTDETGVTLKNFAIAPDGVVSKVYISTIQSIGLIIPARKASWK